MASDISGIKAGEAFVEISARHNQFDKALRDSRDKLKGLGEELVKTTAGLAAVGSVPIAALTATAHIFAEAGSAILDMSQRTGASVAALSELKYAAVQTGADLSAVETAMTRMNKALSGAVDEFGSASGAMDKLGVSAEEVKNLSVDQRFELMTEKIAAIKDPTERAGAALSIFGRSGTSMLPMLANGSAGMIELRKRAEELGLTMKQSVADKAHALGDAFEDLKLVSKQAMIELGAAVSSTIQEFTERIMAATVAVNQFVKAHPDLVNAALKISAAIAAIVVPITSLGLAMQGMSFAIGGLRSTIGILGSFSSALGGIATALPLLAGIAAIAGSMALLVQVFDHFTSSTVNLSNATNDLLEARDRSRKSDEVAIAKLASLADQQDLNGEQLQEAANLIAELETKYGAFGVSIDQTTGKVNAQADAWERLNELKRAAASSDIDAAIAEHQVNRNSIVAGIGDALTDSQRSERLRWLDKEDKAIKSLIERRKALWSTDKAASAAAATGSPPLLEGIDPERSKKDREATNKAIEEQAIAEQRAAKEAVEAQKRQAESLLSLQEEIAVAKAKLSGDEMDAINQRYDFEIKKARLAGDIAKASQLEVLRQIELQSEAQKQLKERNDQFIEADQTNSKQAGDNAELVIKLKTRGLEQELALNEKRRQDALEEANRLNKERRANFLPEVDTRLINQQFDLQAALARRAASRDSVVGTFSASEAKGLFGRGPEDKMAEIAEGTNQIKNAVKLLSDIKNAIANGTPLVFI